MAVTREKVQIAEIKIFDPDSIRDLVMDLKESDSEFDFELVGGTKIEDSEALKIFAEDTDVGSAELLKFAVAVTGDKETAQFIFDLGYRSKELDTPEIEMDWESLENLKKREREKIKT